MKTMKLIYLKDNIYKLKIDNWSLTGTLRELSDTCDEVFEPEVFLEYVKNYINNQ